MKKFSLMCLPVICAAIAPLSADVARTNQHGYGCKKPKRMRCETRCEPCKPCEPRCDPLPDVITPEAPPCVRRNSVDPFITAEYIFWKAEEQGLDYAASGITQSLGTSTTKGRLYHPHFSYSSGFKVGLGFKFRHDGWDLYANYTWLRPEHSTRSTTRHDGQDLQGTWRNPASFFTGGIVDEVTTASSSWKLEFNALDLELGRDYYISHRLTLRPFIGLKFGWIDQDYKVTYEDIGGAPNRYSYKFDQDQFGVGIRTGLNTAWFMWNKWSIFGNFAASAVYSDFDDHQKLTFQDVSAKLDYLNFKFGRHTVIPVLEFALGLRFQTDFSCERYQFLLQAGWEEQIWFDVNQFSNVQDNRQGNLTMQGLTVKAGFSF